LPFTGSNLLWAVLAGFALLAVGLALRRIFPRREA
jgi:LPXTG-motif cell wall-anchored protein